MEHRRTYRSLKPTVKRLHQAQTMCFRFRQLTHEYALRPSGACEI